MCQHSASRNYFKMREEDDESVTDKDVSNHYHRQARVNEPSYVENDKKLIKNSEN